MRKWWVPGLGRYFVRHPREVLTVARAAWPLRREKWWRSSPWLPVPPSAYWEFRMTTAQGEDGHLDPAEVVSAAKWTLRQSVGR